MMHPDILMLIKLFKAQPQRWLLATDQVAALEYPRSLVQVRAQARAKAMAYRPKELLINSLRYARTASSAPINALKAACGVCVYAPARAYELLRMPVPQVTALALSGDHEALVMLPAVIAVNMSNP